VYNGIGVVLREKPLRENSQKKQKTEPLAKPGRRESAVRCAAKTTINGLLRRLFFQNRSFERALTFFIHFLLLYQAAESPPPFNRTLTQSVNAYSCIRRRNRRRRSIGH
jgi:hypothetical protein